MTIASFGVLVGLLLAQLAVYCVGLSVSVGDSLTLPCHGAPSRDVEWRFQQYEYPDLLLVAKLHTESFSPGSDFQGRVESFYLTEPGNYSLLLSPVVYSDLGFYECQYKDGIILSHMKIETRIPSSVLIVMGMSVSLPCFGNIKKHTSAADLDILWMRGGETVYQLLNHTIAYGPGFENRASVSPEQALYGHLSLTTRQTRFSDEGDYQCFYSSPKESGNPDSVRLVVTAPPPSAGLSAGAVAGIVLGVLGVLAVVVLLVLGAFAFWKCLQRRKRAEPGYQAASAEDQNDSNSRAAGILNPDGPESPLSASETQPALPQPHLPMSESDPSPIKPHLPMSESDPSPSELHLPEPQTEHSDLIERHRKISESVEPLWQCAVPAGESAGMNLFGSDMKRERDRGEGTDF